eukprot:17915-Heterococcus_DN1.PRE.2
MHTECAHAIQNALTMIFSPALILGAISFSQYGSTLSSVVAKLSATGSWSLLRAAYLGSLPG